MTTDRLKRTSGRFAAMSTVHAAIEGDLEVICRITERVSLSERQERFVVRSLLETSSAIQATRQELERQVRADITDDKTVARDED